MLPVLPCVHSCHLGLQNTIRNLESVYLYQPDLFILHVDFAAWSMRVLIGTPYQLSLENDFDSRNVFKNPAKAIFLH